MGVPLPCKSTYANITDENLCARNLRIVGLVQKSAGIFDASKVSAFTVCPMIITVNVEIFDGVFNFVFRPWTQPTKLNIYVGVPLPLATPTLI